jgi:hypothetical protein
MILKSKKKENSPATPDEKAQRNFTDPDSRIMKASGTKSFEQCYNAQAVVDSECQVIVSCHLSQSSTDSGEVEPALDGLEENLGFIPFKLSMSMDSAYFSEGNVLVLEEAGIDPFIAVRRTKHSDSPPPPAPRGRIPDDLTASERMERKLRTERGQKVYCRRKAIIEPVFGQIKQARGLRQFLLRGFENTSAEWALWCLTHNLLKLYRHGNLS